jgi:AcrR family transcriptional regulator
VLDAARRVVSTDGLAALSMRRIAGELGVAPNALYSHVADKGALLDLLLDDGLAGITPPDPAGEPGPELRAVMTATYDALLARPTLVPLYLGRQGSRGPHAQALGRVMDALLVRRGLDAERAADVRRVLIVHTIGFAAFAVGSEGPLDAAALRRNFELGLDLLLAGS